MSQSSKKYVKFGSAITIIVIALSYLAYTGVKESRAITSPLKSCVPWAIALIHETSARFRQCEAGHHQVSLGLTLSSFCSRTAWNSL